ncbi:MAG TPA: hypothetical protein VHZ73_07310 [Vicinamibacterales bacterium]|jgi:hypothetical protein|nr:hypothetical protein [Vicinamibacterales bacterium]
MRVFGQCAVLVLLAAGVLRAVQAPAVDPATVLSAAREAMGGEKRFAAVKSFTATGRTQQVRGDNLVPIEFEINCELPDKYSRRDEIPAQESGPTTLGFNGDALIQLPAPAPAPARAGVPPPTDAQLQAQRAARATAAKQDFARLTLGMFAASFPGYPLTFTYVGQAEAPQGKADVLEAKGPGNFTARLFIYRETHLPIMVSWQGAPAPVENRLYYADYRDVDGMKFPFRLRRAVGADTTEETTFDKFKINPKIDAKKFEVAK